MARPFPNTFDSDSSITPHSAGRSNTPISYATNVNRQKTTKWTQAKAVDYGGDDWGDEDDYDYDPPPPVSKPTGLRQQGQGLQPAIEQSMADQSKKAFGQLPALPGARDARGRGRSNSFDANEERNFSNSTIRQPSPSTAPAPARSAGPATRFSQITGLPSTKAPNGPPPLHISTQQPPTTGLRKASQPTIPIIAESAHTDIPQHPRQSIEESSSVPTSPILGSASDTRTPLSDYQARRDYSPSAVPPPLTTRASPAPQISQDSASPSTRFPARKSSLSQAAAPNLSGIMKPSQEASAPKPWTAPRSSSPGARPRAPTLPGTGKTLPFIRPADIYRRAEEERQSLDSGRPSMDSLMGPRTNDSSELPVKLPLRERSSSESMSSVARRRPSFEGDEISESGRRLMPKLEPVRERKSEYGFDGFNVGEPAQKEMLGQSHQAGEEGQKSNDNQLEIEQVRRLSTSPKLPDLNRISGFGLELFSMSSNEDRVVTYSEPETSASGTTLRNQPSIGLRSVVHQAFDRADDGSVPPTPVSRTGSGVKRNDSESTGTTGISPIMSRVPSAVSPESRNRDFVTPSILEVVDEPSSPESGAQASHASQHRETSLNPPQPTIPGFKPGHRRDISTPSPGNSPARTPELATSTAKSHRHEAVVADGNPTSNDPLLSLRPLPEREQSFRPVLPGAWASYSTANMSDTPQSEGEMAGLVRASTPVSVNSSSEEHENEDYENTPTKTEQYISKSPLGATAGAAALGGVAEGALGQHEQGGSNDWILAPPRDSFGNDTLPSPDSAMAPSGNVYSRIALDPRLLPELEQAPAETQLRPDTVEPAAPGEKITSPTPPEKYSAQQTTKKSSGYFPKSSLPLKQNPLVQGGPDDKEFASPPEPQPEPISALHLDNEESDRIHDKIVRNLSPQRSDASRSNAAMLSSNLDEGSHNAQGRESTYLPSEYDHYWASAGDIQDSIPTYVQPPANEHVDSENDSAVNTNLDESETPPIPPLNANRKSQLLAKPMSASLPHRFSWEKSSENIAAPPLEPAADDSASGPSYDNSPPEHSPDEDMEEPEVEPKSRPSMLVQHSAHLYENQPGLMLADGDRDTTGRVHSEDRHAGRDAALVTGGAMLGASIVVAAKSSDSTGRRLSLAEEKDPRISSYPVSPTPPEDEHPSRSLKPYFETTTDQPLQSTSTAAPQTHLPLNTRPTQNGKILAFKEIAAIKSQHDRIQMFDETRHRYATMDSGLTDWLLALQAQHPEHGGVTGSWATSFGAQTGSSRSKYAKAIGAGTTNLQPPYYQQYLNASSPAPSAPSSKPGPSFQSGGAQQGFSPAAVKTSSQQVQAKGKELLHTAGIFGGKAGKAGKGLLAKGKSRFRGAGGGDKTSPPAKPNSEWRASWGPRLTLSRSSGRHDSSSSRQQMDLVTELGDQQATPTTSMTPQQNSSMYLPPGDDVVGMMSGAFPDSSPLTSRHNEAITSHEVISKQHAVSEAGDGDLVGPPAPFAKTQPSWDPFNATPIVEEEVFKYNKHSNQYTSQALITNHPKDLSVPEPHCPISTRSNSEDTRFYSAAEDSNENDWVMVSPEPVVKDSPSMQGGAKSNPTPPAVSPMTEPTSVVGVLDRPRAYTMDSPYQPTTARLSSNSSIPLPTTAQHEYTPADTMELEKQAQEPGKSSFLPPIRRTSTFGLGFGPRQKKPRFPIEDAEEQALGPGLDQSYPREDESGVSTSRILDVPSTSMIIGRDRSADPSPEPHGPLKQASVTKLHSSRPSLINTGSSNDNQYTTPRTDVYQSPTNLNRSQDAWRPNTAVPPASPGGQRNGAPSSISRNSWEPQRNRAMSNSSPTVRDAPYNDRSPWAGPANPLKSFEQPPSSAQRYPDLFRSEAGSDIHRDSADLPAHYYQAPIGREEAFLPRQQTSEYQIPGVGPPAENPQSPGSRRNSGFFKELGGRISRGASVERHRSRSRSLFSRSREGIPSSSRPLDSRGNEYAPSSVASEEAREGNKRRSSFFGSLNRSSTVGLGPPQSRESVLGHHSSLQTDLLVSEEPASIAQRERKRSFFGSSSTASKSKLLSRASTSGAADDSGKKKRFSSLTNFFGKPEYTSSKTSLPVQPRSQTTREMSHHERHPSEPSLSKLGSLSVSIPAASSHYISQEDARPSDNRTRGSSRSRLLSRFTAQSSSLSRESPRESKPRRSSAAGLLNGIIGRKSHQQDRETEDSRSQGSQPQIAPQPLPTARTYTEMQQEEQELQRQNEQRLQQQIREQSLRQHSSASQDAVYQGPERGRQTSREPQYDQVPIPSGYSLVRGQGATAVQSEYDPRGLNHVQQVDHRYSQGYSSQHNTPPPINNPNFYNPVFNPRRVSQNNRIPQQSSPYQDYQPDHSHEHRVQNHAQQFSQLPPGRSENESQQSPHLESSDNHSVTRRLSRDDVLARSPARLPEGQQPPYQLSLPDDDSDDEPPPPPEKDYIIEPSPGSRTLAKPNPAESLQPSPSPMPKIHQPLLHHPPGKWESQSSHLDPHFQPSRHSLLSQTSNRNLGIDINRSDTRRTASSQVSNLSEQQEDPRAVMLSSEDKETGQHSGPSPVVTPPRIDSPTLSSEPEPYVKRGKERAERALIPNSDNENENRKTAQAESSDLYNATPPNATTHLHPPPSIVNINTPDAQSQSPEEKILAHPQAQTQNEDDPSLIIRHEMDAEPTVSMSATSYPGQEWNPYVMGFEEGD